MPGAFGSAANLVSGNKLRIGHWGCCHKVQRLSMQLVGIAENSTYFLRRNGQFFCNLRDLAIFSHPHFWNDDLSEFFCDLLKALVASQSVGPGSQGLVYTNGMKNT
jgi:hypothetical protein